MKNLPLSFAFIYIFYCSMFYLCDACDPSKYCQVEQWSSWFTCNATCGGGVQERQKIICCNPYIYNSLKGCSNGCNIPLSWWEANATEHKTCGMCQTRGTFDVIQNSCICPSGYGGSCCDLQTTLPTTMKTTTTTTIPTTSKTTTIPSTSKTTKNMITSCTGNPCKLGTCIPMNNQYFCLCSPGYEGHNCDKGTGNISYNSPNGNGNMNMMSSCLGDPCQHGTCLPMSNRYLCFCDPGYEGRNCQIDTDECENDPCQYGQCIDKVNDFHCDCNVFFQGKKCTKLKTWAIVFIALSALALCLTCCCCFWCVSTCTKKDAEKGKIGPVVEPLPEKPMPRPSSIGKPNAWLL